MRVKSQRRNRVARIRLSTIEAAARLRPAGYLAAVLESPAEVRDGWVHIPEHRYSALREHYKTSRPSLVQEILGFFREIGRWKAAGFAISDWRTFLSRTKACGKCPYSFGKMIPRCGRCGCTRAKALLASARCVEGRWG